MPTSHVPAHVAAVEVSAWTTSEVAHVVDCGGSRSVPLARLR